MRIALALVSTLSLMSLLATVACTNEAAEPKADTKMKPATKAAASQPKSSAVDPVLEKGISPATREQKDADGVVRRGSMTTAAVMSVPAVFDKAKDLQGKSVRVEGTVHQVCAVKGCWMVVKDEDKSIRITSKGYKFFVPKDAKGKKAIIEGDLVVKELTKEEAQHLEDDAAAAKGGKAKQVESGHIEVQIAAVGLELRS